MGLNRCGSTLVLSNKNPMLRFIIIFIFQHGLCKSRVEQHGFYTISTLHAGHSTPARMVFTLLEWVFVKNQPKKLFPVYRIALHLLQCILDSRMRQGVEAIRPKLGERDTVLSAKWLLVSLPW